MKTSCCLVALSLLCVLSAFAAEPEHIVVTASRTAQDVDEVLASVTVIDHEDIAAQQASSMQDLLRNVAGISLSNNGGLGKSTDLFLRGTESDHLLVLVDGIRTGSATTGTAPLQDIPVELIDRIEIVRGPRSSLYGSEAIGGVMQIFTRRRTKSFTPAFSVGAGSHDTYRASGSLSGGNDQGWYNFSAGGTDSKGFNACDGRPSPGGAGCFTIEPDRDGYRNVSAAISGGFGFKNGLQLDSHFTHSDSETAFDGDFVNESRSIQKITGSTLSYAPSEQWQTSLDLGRSSDANNNFKDGAFRSRFASVRDTVSFQNDFTVFTDQLFTLGVDYQKDRIDSTENYTVTSRNNTATFSQYRGTTGSHSIQASLRRDNNEQFDVHTTGSAAWGYSFDETFLLSTSYGTAFKAPTFNELYYPDYGNPDLQPETSSSFEIGLNGKFPRWRFSVNTYETRIDELIAFDATTFRPGNIAQARIRGVESELAAAVENWRVDANLTLLETDNLANGANYGNKLPRRAKQSLRLDAGYKRNRCAFGATLIATGKRYDDLANTHELGSYTTLDLRAEITLAINWKLQVRLENALNENYETAAFFNQDRRTFNMTLRYQP